MVSIRNVLAIIENHQVSKFWNDLKHLWKRGGAPAARVVTLVQPRVSHVLQVGLEETNLVVFYGAQGVSN